MFIFVAISGLQGGVRVKTVSIASQIVRCKVYAMWNANAVRQVRDNEEFSCLFITCQRIFQEGGWMEEKWAVNREI